MTYTRVQSEAAITSATQSPAVSLGAGPTQGNLLLAWVVSGVTAPIVSPGWTQVINATGLVSAALYRKVAGASEPSVVSWASQATPGNLLSYNTESVETSAASWGAGVGSPGFDWSTAQALDGTHSIALTSSGAGNMSMFPNSAGIPSIAASTPYTCSCWMYAAAAGQYGVITVDWYNGSTFISSNSVSSVPLTQNQWTLVSFTPTSAVGSNLARLIPGATASAGGVTVYLDEMFLGTVPSQSYAVAGIHEYAGNTPTPYDNSGFAAVYQDSGSLSAPGETLTLGGQHELVFALEALRTPLAASTPGSPAWSGGPSNLVPSGALSDGATGTNVVAAIVGDQLDSGTATSDAVGLSWSTPQYRSRTTLVASFLSVTGAGFAVSSSDAGSGSDAASPPHATLSNADAVGHPAFDAGETIVQTGPYPTSDAGSAAESVLVRLSSSDASAQAADAGSVNNVATFYVYSADASQKPTVFTPEDTDRGVASDSETVPHATLSSADTGSGLDGA